MSIQLSIPAEQCLQRLNLEESHENTLRKIISRYSPPETFCQALSWTVYRICNAIASLFGASDWQKAQQLVRENLRRIAHEEGLFNLPSSQGNNEQRRQIVEQELDNLVNEQPILNDCLKYNFVFVNERRPELDLPGLRDVIVGENFRSVINASLAHALL